MIGQRLDQYRVLARIGEGGMGTVYRALDETLGREVAIKLLRPELAGRSDVVERFRSEAMTLGRLTHPNIATLHGLSSRGQDLFMVMEFVRGETLEEVLRRVGRLPWTQAVRVGRQALSALAYAHGLNVVHRDIKPSNLMLDPEGRLKVMDFGLARVLGSSRATRIGHIVGTLEYMAPEQIRGEDADGRSDQYALGIVLYEMLAGATPFKAKSDYALMTAHLEHEAAPLAAALPDVPAWLDAAVRRALGKRREDRFPTAHEFRAALSTGAEAPPLPETAGTGRSVLVEDTTDPLPFGIATAARASTAPPTRLAATPARTAAPLKATRLAQSGAPTPHASQQVPAAVEDAAVRPHGRMILAAAAIGAFAVLALFLSLNLGEPRVSGADTRVSTSAVPSVARETLPYRGAPAVAAPPAPATSSPPEYLAPRAPAASPSPDGVIPRERPPAAVVGPDLPPPLPPPPADTVEARPVRPTRTFEGVNLVLGDREVEVELLLQADRMLVRDVDAGRIVKSIPYADVDAASYSTQASQTKSGGSAIARVFKAPAKLIRRTRHVFTVRTDRDTVVLRLDGDEVNAVLPAFEERSGLKVAR